MGTENSRAGRGRVGLDGQSVKAAHGTRGRLEIPAELSVEPAWLSPQLTPLPGLGSTDSVLPCWHQPISTVFHPHPAAGFSQFQVCRAIDCIFYTYIF